MRIKQYDVIVAGGGLTGSFTARKLAEKGHKVLILEREQQLGHRLCCTGIIGQECAEAFGVEDGIVLRQVNSGTVFSPASHRIKLAREKPQACILDRVALDITMAEQAQKSGADLELGASVEGAVTEKDSIKVKVSKQGKDATIPTRALVIATGFSPELCHRLGLGKYADFGLGAQAEVETTSSQDKEVEVYFGKDTAPGFFAWLVPTTESRARAGLITRNKPGFYLKRWLAKLQNQGKITSTEVSYYYGVLPLRPLPATCGERFLAVGDAAGQVKPTSGGGVYYGLLAAGIAATTLHQALEEDNLSAQRLSQYEKGWRQLLGQELKTGYRARKFFERLSDRQIDLIFKIMKTSGIEGAILKADNVSFDWHSKTMMSILRYQTISRAAGLIRSPFTRKISQGNN
jgi:geranylgeranyl reductase family protein